MSDLERKTFLEEEIEANKAGLTNSIVYPNPHFTPSPLIDWPSNYPWPSYPPQRQDIFNPNILKELEKQFPKKRQEDDPINSYVEYLKLDNKRKQETIDKLQAELDNQKLIKSEEVEPEIILNEISTKALRYNQGKNRLGLIPPEFTEEIGKVFTFGAQKYNDNNWRKGLKYSNLIDSIERHLLEIKKGNDIDPESGLLHSAHLGANIAFLIWNQHNRPDLDDRFINRPLRIGLDIDDVVLDFIGAYCERYQLPEPTSWHFDPLFKERYQELCEDNDFWLNLKPLIDPKELSFEPVVYITARQCGAEITKKWLEINGFPQVPVEVIGLNESKLEIAKKYQLDIFVDDRIDTFYEFNSAGIYCLLFDRSHNRQSKDYGRRIRSLKEIK